METRDDNRIFRYRNKRISNRFQRSTYFSMLTPIIMSFVIKDLNNEKSMLRSLYAKITKSLKLTVNSNHEIIDADYKIEK